MSQRIASHVFAFYVAGLTAIFATGCNRSNNVDNLYRFSNTKAVKAHAVITLAQNSATLASTQVMGEKFLLAAFLMDDGGTAVSFLVNGQELTSIPVTLAGASTALDVELLVPTAVVPSTGAYNFHFQMQPTTAVSTAAQAPPAPSVDQRDRHKTVRVRMQTTGSTKLDAVCGDVVPGTPASQNTVELSIASSLAYDLVLNTAPNSAPIAFIMASTSLKALLEANQSLVEAAVDVSVGHSLTDYLAAMTLGLQSLLVNDTDIQSQAVQILSAAAVHDDNQTNVQSTDFVAAFSAALQTAAQNITSQLGDKVGGVSQVFSGGYAAQQSAGASLNGNTALSFLPAAVTFIDTDSSSGIGGDVFIAPPPFATGISSYSVYLGGDSPSSNMTLLGTVVASAHPIYHIANGTTVPAGATHIWVQPKSGSQTLGFFSTVFKNLIESESTTSTAPSVPTLTATPSASRIGLSWTSVPGASAYSLYVSTTLPVTMGVPLATGTSTQYQDFNPVYGTAYYYAVTATVEGHESAMSASVMSTLGLDPPSLSAQSPGSEQINVSVTMATNADHLNLYRSTTLPIIPSDLIYSGTYADFNWTLSANTIYYFSAESIDAVGHVSPMAQVVGSVTDGVYPPSNAPAIAVLGQQGFASTGAGCAPQTFAGPPVGLAIDRDDNLFVSDPYANRILGFYSLRTATGGMSAHLVLGQTDFAGAQSGVGATRLHTPLGLAFDTVTQIPVLLAADSVNARVVYYDSSTPPLLPNQNITLALGAANVNAVGTAAALGAIQPMHPVGCAIVTGTTIIADAAANRVLIYSNPYAPQAVPTVVLGQPDLTTVTQNNGGLSAQSLNHPTSVWSDGQRLLVYDAGNARVLYYQTMPTANFAPADFVLGQANLTTAHAATPGVTSSSTLTASLPDDLPAGLSSDGTQIAVVDQHSNRVLIFNQFPSSNGVAADRVLGQANFTSIAAASPPASHSLKAPTSVQFWGANHLLVADSGNNRVLFF